MYRPGYHVEWSLHSDRKHAQPGIEPMRSMAPLPIASPMYAPPPPQYTTPTGVPVRPGTFLHTSLHPEKEHTRVVSKVKPEDPQPAGQPKQRVHGLAVVGFSAGLLALTCLAVSFYVCAFFGILAIAASLRALRDIRRRPDLYKGKWMALAGLVAGSLAILVAGLLTVSYFAS